MHIIVHRNTKRQRTTKCRYDYSNNITLWWESPCGKNNRVV